MQDIGVSMVTISPSNQEIPTNTSIAAPQPETESWAFLGHVSLKTITVPGRSKRNNHGNTSKPMGRFRQTSNRSQHD